MIFDLTGYNITADDRVSSTLKVCLYCKNHEGIPPELELCGVPGFKVCRKCNKIYFLQMVLESKDARQN